MEMLEKLLLFPVKVILFKKLVGFSENWLKFLNCEKYKINCESSSAYNGFWKNWEFIIAEFNWLEL